MRTLGGHREAPRAGESLGVVRVQDLGLGKGSKCSIWEGRGNRIKERAFELGFAGRVGVS